MPPSPTPAPPTPPLRAATTVSLKEVEVEVSLASPPSITLRPLSPAGCFQLGELSATLRASGISVAVAAMEDVVELRLKLGS